MNRKKTPLILGIFSALLAVSLFQGIRVFASSFYDVPEGDLLFSPYIENLYSAHLITGDTQNGIPTHFFRPDDTLTRAELTKVAVGIKLAEKYGTSENWEEKSEYQMTETVLKDKLLYFHKCDNSDIPNCSSIQGADITGICNVCQLTNEKPFTDVKEKERNCEEQGICTPWYSEYIYYALRKGMLQGYNDGSSFSFHPNEPILRIHALKLIMADSGAVDPEADERYRRLSQTAKSRGAYYPKCLTGAEPYILRQNGGTESSDARKLLAYALLADQLDFFGNQCQVFKSYGANTPEARATFLHSYLTRQEVARYFVLSTSYPPLQISPSTDPTVDEIVSYAYDPDRPEDEGESLIPTPLLKENSENENAANNEPSQLYLADTELSIAQLTSRNKQGRCCKSKDLYPAENCKIITFKSYSISEESDYNWLTYNGPAWHLATNSWDACWVPYPDILGGYVPPEPESDYEILRRMAQRRREIYGNLDNYYLAGHSLEEARDYGLGGGQKTKSEIADVNEWYKIRSAREQEIYRNLDAYYNTTHDLAKTVEYGYTADKLPIENHWVLKWYEKKKKAIEAYLAAQRAAQLAASRAATQQQELPWYLKSFEPLMPALTPIYDAYIAPAVDNFTDTAIDAIVYNIEQQRLKEEFPQIYTADYYGNKKDVKAASDDFWSNNPVTKFAQDIGSAANEYVIKPVGDAAKAAHQYTVDKAEEALDQIKNTAAAADGIVMGLFHLTPTEWKPAVQPFRSTYNLGKGAMGEGVGMVEDIVDAYEDPLGTAEDFITLANMGFQLQSDPFGMMIGTNPASEDYHRMNEAVATGVTDFVVESFSSRDKFEENFGRLSTYLFGFGEAKSLLEAKSATKILKITDNALDVAKALDKMDLTEARKILNEMDDLSLSKIVSETKNVDELAKTTQLAEKVILNREAADRLSRIWADRRIRAGDPTLKLKSELNDVLATNPGSYTRQFEIVENSIENIPGATGKVDPHSIRFSQSVLSNRLSNGEEVSALIERLKSGGGSAADLQRGRTAAEEIRIKIVKVDGKWFSLNNRRLFAFKEANIPVRYEIVDMSTKSGFKNTERYLSTYTDGKIVIINNKVE